MVRVTLLNKFPLPLCSSSIQTRSEFTFVRCTTIDAAEGEKDLELVILVQMITAFDNNAACQQAVDPFTVNRKTMVGV